MKTYRSHRNALAISAAALLLAGCGARQSLPSPTGTTGAAIASSSTNDYSIVYNFSPPPDAAVPASVLKDVSGTLYGTSDGGGVEDCSDGTGTYFVCGAIFGVTTSGTEVLLHPFTVGDGAEPASGFIYVKGTLYGTTLHGGGPGSEGVVYGITPSGTDTVLHAFHRAIVTPENPNAGLVYLRGVFYGTTGHSGPRKSHKPTFGTAFTLTPSGAFHILYRFKGGSDGATPGSLINVGGILYGITRGGGSSASGTFYSLTTAGAEHVLYSFKGEPDGTRPANGLIVADGTIYGATSYGGKSYCSSSMEKGCGVIYSITTSGTENVIYSFTGGADGKFPNGNLVYVNGLLYGTTEEGGMYKDGTIFSLTLSGTETVLHNFSNIPDGSEPGAGLIYIKHTLYGTTRGGGTGACGIYTQYPYGCGTIFALKLK